MNKIEKLELKHLCGYLPYGLNFIIESGLIFKLRATHIFNNHTGIYKGLEKQAKLLLLPLSALTEPLEDGTVPIVELAKIAGLNFIKIDSIQITNGWIQILSQPKDSFYRFVYDSKTMGFRYYIDGNLYHLSNQLQLFEYLYLKHFDIYGLIDAGLAIDKRTVNQ